METHDNLTAVLYGVNDLRLENLPIPEIQENEVLLRMSQVGICGSDVSYLTKGKIGDFVVRKPMIIGHEAAGIVQKCGIAVKYLQPGDRVAIEPGVPCRICDYCKRGRYNLCPEMIFCATPPCHGNLTRYYKHAADFCFKLPDHVSLEEGAMLEPLSVAVHACQRANVRMGSRILICGAGPIGLLNLLTARAFGASKICITDVVDARLEIATRLGVDATLNALHGTPEEQKDRVAQLMGGQMPDITIECTGVESSVKLGIISTRSGGTMLQVGHGKSELKIPIVDATTREIDIKGIFRYVNCYPTALEMIATGKIDVKPLITHRFKLEETLHAFETARTGAGNAIKVMISC